MSSPSKQTWSATLTAIGFITVGAVVRLMPHPPNLTPLIAMALFAGAWLSPSLAIALTVATMLVGDVAIGWVPQNLMGYVGLAAIVGLGHWVRARQRPLVLAGTAVAGSTLFFLLSNFGVWLEGWLYPRTLDGLLACYTAGLPFYRRQLAGDLAYTALFFGAFHLVMRWQRWAVPHPSTVSSGA